MSRRRSNARRGADARACCRGAAWPAGADVFPGRGRARWAGVRGLLVPGRCSGEIRRFFPGAPVHVRPELEDQGRTQEASARWAEIKRKPTLENCAGSGRLGAAVDTAEEIMPETTWMDNYKCDGQRCQSRMQCLRFTTRADAEAVFAAFWARREAGASGCAQMRPAVSAGGGL